MITAPVTAAIAALLALFGVKLTVAQIAGVAVGVKILLVLTGVFLGGKLLKRRQAPPEKQPDPKTP